MTVGISLTNGIEAIVITDRRVSSSQQRESDVVDKTIPFKADDYHGVIFASGMLNMLGGVVANQDSLKGDNLGDYITNLQKLVRQLEGAYDMSFLEGRGLEVRKKATIIPDVKDRAQFEMSELSKLFEYYEREFKRETATRFVAVAYDKKVKGVRMFSVQGSSMCEIFYPNNEIGSGSDGANFYFTMKLQGFETKNFNVVDLLFHTLNAYSLSTVNSGVGGMPRITHITADAATALPTDKTAALVNIDGAYLAGFNGDITQKKMSDLIENIFSGGTVNYDAIALLIGLNREALISMAIPYRSWQERVNLNSQSLK